MIGRMRLHAMRRDDDRGASLILVLVFVASFGLIVPALLTQAQTSVSSIAVTREVGRISADAEAAADRATNQIRRGDFYNEPAQHCFHDPADTFGVNDSDVRSYDSLTVGGQQRVRPTLVTCQAGPATGYPTSVSVPVTAGNSPGQALLTLGRNSETGLRQTANNTLRIQGRVFSNSTVEVTNPNARLEVDNAPLIARGACTGGIFGTPKSCNDTSQDALGVDPMYALPSTLPPLRSAPACTGGNHAYALVPGRYTSASALSGLTRNSCGALLHFTPGVYYFDFADPTPVWTVTDGYVVGGTIPTGARAWSLSGYPGTRPTVPGACVTPLELTVAQRSDPGIGVTFVFGAASRMSISGGGKVELCGQYSATRPPIAVFGANTGSGTGPVTRTILSGGAASSGNPKFENLGRIRDTDTSSSDAALVGNGSQGSASVTINLASSAVPAGAVLLEAKLWVVHRDLVGPSTLVGSTTYPAGPIATATATITPRKPNPGDPTPPSVTPSNPLVIRSDTAADPYREDVLDVTAGLKPYFDARGFAGADVDYAATVTTGKAATEMLDSLRLDVTYEVPGFRANNGCVSATPYTNGSGPCALIFADGSNPDTRLYIQGTTYAPLAALDITLNNVSEQVFKFGVIARAVKVAITGSSSFTGAVIAVPGLNPGYAATVPLAAYLQVYVCETGSCAPPGPVTGSYVPAAASGWVRRLSTQVRVTDAAYPPTAGVRKVDVVSWYHPR